MDLESEAYSAAFLGWRRVVVCGAHSGSNILSIRLSDSNHSAPGAAVERQM